MWWDIIVYGVSIVASIIGLVMIIGDLIDHY